MGILRLLKFLYKSHFHSNYFRIKLILNGNTDSLGETDKHCLPNTSVSVSSLRKTIERVSPILFTLTSHRVTTVMNKSEKSSI